MPWWHAREENRVHEPVAPFPVPVEPPTGGASPDSPVIAIDHVSVVREGIPILDDVTWTVGPGQRWALLGPNGSGKTTLLKVAGSALWPTSGTVEILGERLGRV